MDIFYEPYQGVVMHGNRELGSGIAKVRFFFYPNRLNIKSGHENEQGAASFLKKTTYGLTDSLTKFTSSVGKGLSSATFDAEYQERRRLAQRRNKPRHALYGFASGAGAFLDSLGSAGQGVIVRPYLLFPFTVLMNHKAQPVAGFRDEGGFGFLKGIGKGLAG
jgi:vacuolar protein sorting-associated protein 13A/C